jgi:hypothetical protein
MQRSLSRYLLAAVTLAAFGSIAFGQQAQSTKADLITEFRKLTGANKVDGSINFSPDSVQQVFTSIIEEDKELTVDQKAGLTKTTAEPTARIYKLAQDAVADKAEIIGLSEKVIYDIYDKSFTESELSELVIFYRTTAGQKALHFLPSLSSEVQKQFGAVIQVRMNKILQPEIQLEIEKLKERIKETKTKRT